MSDTTLLKLFPDQKCIPPTNDEFAANFLDVSLVPDAGSPPLIFANLLSSLDGRIAVRDPSVRSGMSTPASIRSDLDWKLFCHLQAHADVLVTHSGYLRSLESNELGNILNLAGKQSYLHAFRKQAGLSDAPHVVVLTSSLDFDHTILKKALGPVTLLVTRKTPMNRMRLLRAEGLNVVQTDDQHSIAAHTTVRFLESISARNAYLQTGPEMLHDMLNHQLLQRLFLTMDFSFIGGDLFKTLCEGRLLQPPAKMQLQTAYLASMVNKHQQLYLSFCTAD